MTGVSGEEQRRVVPERGPIRCKPGCVCACQQHGCECYVTVSPSLVVAPAGGAGRVCGLPTCDRVLIEQVVTSPEGVKVVAYLCEVCDQSEFFGGPLRKTPRS